jgi:DNA-binding beta-propeller fold protein YncE
MKIAPAFCALVCACAADMNTAPTLPYHVVENWAKLPAGWTLAECSSVTASRDGHIWVFNRSQHPVIEFDRDGNLVQAWPEFKVGSSHGIREDAQGNIWGVDTKRHAVVKYSRAGKVLMTLGDPGGKPGGNESHNAFNLPTGIAFAPNGDFFVTDGYGNSRVVRFDKNGKYIRHFGRKGTGDGEFNRVHDIAIDGDGRLYIADPINERVQIFDGDGKFLGKWTGIGAPWGLHYVAAEQAMYMCDGTNQRVVKLNLDGKVLGVFGTPGSAAGQFDIAHNLTVDATGAIYVAEIKNKRVQKFVQ